MNAVLSCGHAPSPHSDITDGIAYAVGRRTLCYDCATAEELVTLKTAEKHFAYLTEKNGVKSLTNWPGRTLARVTAAWKVWNNFAARSHHSDGYVWWFRAVDATGARWYGTSPGVGMYAIMHRNKVRAA